MMERTVIYERFVTQFHAGRKNKPCPLAKLDAVEAELGMLWPTSYREFVSTHGAVYTPGLLALVVEKRPGYADVQEFLKPTQTVTETRGWRQLGLPEDGYAFAIDSMGNLFAFRRLPSCAPRPEDAAVWLFDHEYGEIKQEEASFGEWLERFLTLS